MEKEKNRKTDPNSIQVSEKGIKHLKNKSLKEKIRQEKNNTAPYGKFFFRRTQRESAKVFWQSTQYLTYSLTFPTEMMSIGVLQQFFVSK